jgi:BASS family bile acid:Na+ symporter
LPAELAAGLVLVGACPGGTASNVIAFVAKADVALSVTLTSASTLIGVVVTPLLASLLTGREFDLPTAEMLESVATVVLVPVAIGVLLNSSAKQPVRALQPWLPPLTVFCIALIIAIIVAASRDRLQGVALGVLLAVALHNAGGLGLGYYAARRFGLSPRESRTIAIEVGMQNSGLAVALAVKFISPIAALPGAVFSVWHNLSGSLLASYWARRTDASAERGASALADPAETPQKESA